MAEMGLEVSAEGIATYYKEQGLIDGLIADPGDQVNVPGVRVLYTNILMRDGADRARLAREVIEWGVSQTMTWSR
jgi:LPPG:FO 2-phospho-L-lactate transferase